VAILRKKRRQGKKIKLWKGKHRRIKEKGVSEKKRKKCEKEHG
jgi:hypothetical protein